MQEEAHLRDAAGPFPVRTMSSTPAMMSWGSSSTIPAGPTLGQTSTHLPHFVQVSSDATGQSRLEGEIISFSRRSCCFC
jgi:hypothetical protein